MDKIPLIFQAQITQNSPMENSGFTLCRARVFYTGLNRNGSYIDKEFAESFIATAIGCPVVGLWDHEKKDFTDHTPSDRKRAYGFIPEDPQFAWETSYDYDGVEREYASFNVVLWTKAFEEANDIISHPLSMEINPDTIKFTSAEMLGICVLGYNVEPCFEGASFLSVDDMREFKRLFKIDKQQALLSYNTINDKGDTSMEEKEKEMTPVEEFTQIRDDDLDEPEVVEEVPAEPETPAEFTKENEEESVVEEEVPEVFSKDEESEPNEDVEVFQNQITELEQMNKNLNEKINELEDKISNLEKANFELIEYQNNKIKEEKERVIAEYTEILSEEEINGIDMTKFSVEDLNDKLAAMAIFLMKKMMLIALLENIKKINLRRFIDGCCYT